MATVPFAGWAKASVARRKGNTTVWGFTSGSRTYSSPRTIAQSRRRGKDKGEQFPRATKDGACFLNRMNRTATRFEGLLDRYFEQLLQDAPTFAAVMGIRSAEGKLGHLNPRFLAHRERERRAALREMEAISPCELSNEQHLDRLALRSMLLHECED